MFLRPRLLLAVAFVVIAPWFSGCKSIYRDTFTWKKTGFVPPPSKAEDISKVTPPLLGTGAAPIGIAPEAPGGSSGSIGIPPLDSPTGSPEMPGMPAMQ